MKLKKTIFAAVPIALALTLYAGTSDDAAASYPLDPRTPVPCIDICLVIPCCP
jgi:hypothetical protein